MAGREFSGFPSRKHTHMPRVVPSGLEVPAIGVDLAGGALSRRKAFYRRGTCCSAQVLPSGSLKVTNEPHG